MLPWLTDYNSQRPHSALGGQPPLRWIAGLTAAITTTPPATSDPEPSCVGADRVKPREATAKGGLGLTPFAPTQAQSSAGWDNLLGNDS